MYVQNVIVFDVDAIHGPVWNKLHKERSEHNEIRFLVCFPWQFHSIFSASYLLPSHFHRYILLLFALTRSPSLSLSHALLIITVWMRIILLFIECCSTFCSRFCSLSLCLSVCFSIPKHMLALYHFHGAICFPSRKRYTSYFLHIQRE